MICGRVAYFSKLPQVQENRELANRIQLYKANGKHSRWIEQDEAICLISGGCQILGRHGLIRAIRMPGSREVERYIEARRGDARRAKARDIKPRLPMPEPLTTTAESFDNPPKVVKFQHLSLKHREIFASALIGRAGIIADPSARREMRGRIRAAE